MTDPAEGRQLELTFAGSPDPRPQQLLEPDEIFQLDDEWVLRLISEDRRIERKLATIAARELGDYVVMWANTQPNGGLIIVGMEDDGAISGCTRVGQAKMNKLEKVAVTFCPDARIQSRRVGVINTDGKPDYLTLILVRYRPDRLVRNTKGKAFIRIGDSKKTLTDEECREFEIDRGQIDLEQEPVALTYPSGFNTAAVQRFAEAVRISRGLADSHSIEEILQLRHLGVIEKGFSNLTGHVHFSSQRTLGRSPPVAAYGFNDSRAKRKAAGATSGL